jgi:hypothetical protein
MPGKEKLEKNAMTSINGDGLYTHIYNYIPPIKMMTGGWFRQTINMVMYCEYMSCIPAGKR